MDSLVSIRDLHTYFFLDEGVVKAVNGVSLEIPRAKTLCLVGESGCGKSITAFSLLRLISKPGRIVKGNILYRRNGTVIDLALLNDDGPRIRSIRGSEMAMIFQEPMTSLSPVHTVGNQIMEAVLLHTDLDKSAARARTIEVMEAVGIPDAPNRFRSYPHELSGGLRQRIMIAMALSCNPDLLIADEPTTALDVTIQAQILDLMRGIQEREGASILLITHDLAVVAEMADEVAVMYWGRVVEQSSTGQIFGSPLHPYTIALMQSIPSLGGNRKTRLAAIAGSVPDPFAQIAGCAFHPRCPEAEAGLCDQGDRPELIEVAPGHKTACLLRQREGGVR